MVVVVWSWDPQYHHLINLAHPTLLQVHLGPQEPLMLTDFPRHAEVNINTISGPWGGSDCKTKNQEISLRPTSRSPFLPEELHFLECTGDHSVSSLVPAAGNYMGDVILVWVFLQSSGILYTSELSPK